MNDFAKILKGGKGSGRHKLNATEHKLLQGTQRMWGGKLEEGTVQAVQMHDSKSTGIREANAVKSLADKGLVEYLPGFPKKDSQVQSPSPKNNHSWGHYDHFTRHHAKLTDAGRAHIAEAGIKPKS